jgi:hypothetical protein
MNGIWSTFYVPPPPRCAAGIYRLVDSVAPYLGFGDVLAPHCRTNISALNLKSTSTAKISKASYIQKLSGMASHGSNQSAPAVRESLMQGKNFSIH